MEGQRISPLAALEREQLFTELIQARTQEAKLPVPQGRSGD